MLTIYVLYYRIILEYILYRRGNMSAKSQRSKEIISLLTDKKIISIKGLSNALGVSEMTIRRDISELEKQNLIEVFFGGVSLKTDNSSDNHGYQIERESSEKTDEKKRIAQKAVSLIEPNDVILIDTGSTTSRMFDYITDDMNQIVYCYALNVINMACQKSNLRVVACGGYFHSNTSMFESEEGVNLLKKTHLNKVFFGARGISREVGITTAEQYEINVKKAALKVGEKKILLADSSKFGKVWYAKYAELEDIDIIITDSGLDGEFQEMIKDQGIALYVV